MVTNMENFKIKSDFDNLELDVNKYECDNAKASVLVVHGMVEYKERYDRFARFLVENGYEVYTYDHRGHGSSLNENNDFGFFASKNGHIGIVNDLKQVVNYVKDNNENKKLFIFAHSMGTIVTRLFLQENSNLVDKVILSGAPCPNKLAGVGHFIAKLKCMFNGDKKHSKLITKLSLGSFNKKVENPTSNNDWISYNQENIDKYNNDPLCSFTFTNSAYKDLFKMVQLMQKPKRYKNVKSDLEILFLAGKDDPCTGGTKGLNNSINVLVKGGFKNISKKQFENMRHEILNELDYDKVHEESLKFYE